MGRLITWLKESTGENPKKIGCGYRNFSINLRLFKKGVVFIIMDTQSYTNSLFCSIGDYLVAKLLL
jgi:hypothetical protein